MKGSYGWSFKNVALMLIFYIIAKAGIVRGSLCLYLH